ncbi:MAG: bacteriophage abortive infection AbiH family protein [Chitinophagaceae bacterium]|nr:bacteriophage abortive infection AbiH family protein [Chitinophagaceae bacterium]
MSDILYIIGNGFDLHHGLRTSYYNFANYLQKNHSSLFYSLESYISYPASDKSLWSQFESNLANLDVDEIISEHSDLLPDLASDDFKDGDRFIFPDSMQEEYDKLTTGLISAFKQFIIAVDMPASAFQYKVNLDTQATFLTFNYTGTLERLYNVDRNHIHYIHYSVYSRYDEIILGHGMDPAQFDEQPKVPPPGLIQEEEERWCLENDEEDSSYYEGKKIIRQYFKASYKPTADIITKFADFFFSIRNIQHIHVLGHSISEVDLPYFQKLCESISPAVTWHVSFYNDAERGRHLQTLTNLGIDPAMIQQFELVEIHVSNQQLNLPFP